MAEVKNPVTIESFGENLKEIPPMRIGKKEKTGYDILPALSDSILKSIESGKSPFLPNKDGFVDIHPAYNINTNTFIGEHVGKEDKVRRCNSLFQIALLTRAAELGSPTNAFVTWQTIKKAQEAGIECKIIKGEKGIEIPSLDFNDYSKIVGSNKYFNVSQIENADALIAYCKAEMTKKYEEDVAYIKANYPDSTYKEKLNPADKNMEKAATKFSPLNEKTENTVQYLSQALYNFMNGSMLKVTPEQAEAFKSNIIKDLTAEYEPGKRDLLRLAKITDRVNTSYNKNMEKNQARLNNLSQSKEEKEQSAAKKPRSKEPSYERGMGM